jgi:hypothetical protein
MKATFQENGWMAVYMDGEEIKINNPTPSDAARAFVATTMASKGAQFHSSQWYAIARMLFVVSSQSPIVDVNVPPPGLVGCPVGIAKAVVASTAPSLQSAMSRFRVRL